MVVIDKLYECIVNDRAKHPERLNATVERIEEVLECVLGKDDAAKILENKIFDTDKKRESVDDKKGWEMAVAIGNAVTYDQLMRIRRMLMDSEISTAEAIEIHETYKIPVSHLEKDIIPVRGEGAWVVGNDGKLYLDMDSNYSATNLGMANEEIALGLYNQAAQLISMKEDRVHIPRTRFLKNIMEMMPKGLNYFYWQNSGGEAVDKALKIAKAYTEQKGVVAFEGGFHGRTHGAVAVTYNEKYRKPFGLDNQDWVHFAEFNNADQVEELFKEGKAKIAILELVQGEEAGIRPADKKFVKKLRDICDKYNGVMIVDEIQTGFGRTAEKEGQWFSCMTYDVVPDIITIGKSFGGGYPVTAVVTTKEISEKMKGGYDGSTFGGNPMAMVAAFLATRQMREKNITKNVVVRAKQLFDGLENLKKKHELISAVHGKGLMVGFDLPTAEHVAKFQVQMNENGVKTSLSTGNIVRFLPPLILSESEAAFLLEAIDKSITEMS